MRRSPQGCGKAYARVVKDPSRRHSAAWDMPPSPAAPTRAHLHRAQRFVAYLYGIRPLQNIGCLVKGSSNANGGCICPKWLILREFRRAVNGLSLLIRVKPFQPQQQQQVGKEGESLWFYWKVRWHSGEAACDTPAQRLQEKMRFSMWSPTRRQEICFSMTEII